MQSLKHDVLILPSGKESMLAGKTVCCSFSGGADSLALLLFLQEWSRKIPFTLEAVHFEHGFRGGDSLADAAFCRDVCRRENIPFQLFHINAPACRRKGEGDEEAARRLRLDYWHKIVRNPGSTLIAVGHHAEDRAENILLRLFRGSNASGLSSMRSVQRLGELVFIRPLLNAGRGQVEAYLASRGMSCWCHDSTNDSVRYRRNFLRLELLPLAVRKFPFALRGIQQSLRALEADAVCLEQLAAQHFAGMSVFSAAELRNLPSALRVRLLRLFLQRELNLPSFVPDSRLLERFETLVENPRPSARIPLRGFPEWNLCLRHGEFLLISTQENGCAEITWNPFQDELCRWNESLWLRAELLPPGKILYPRDKSSAFFDADELEKHLPLKLSAWRNGDRMIPFGRTESVKLKKLFADAGIGTAEREGCPLVRDVSGEVLWAVLLRNSAWYPVTAGTRRVLRLYAVQKHLQHQC